MVSKPQFSAYTFPGPILFGRGVVREVGPQIRSLGGSRPLLVTGPHIAETGILEQVLLLMKEGGLNPVVYQKAHLNPTDKDVEAGVGFYHQEKCDVVVALGGGSRIDVAKGIRLMTTHSGALEDYYFDNGGAARVTANVPPLVSIPTTAGSGSETSRGAVITDTSTRRKRLITGSGLMSSVAILDPELTASMSPHLTAICGIDALSHALETYVGTNVHPIAEGIAHRAAIIMSTSLPRAVEDGTDMEARSQMLIASAMVALCFGKGLGVVHSMAHPLSPEANMAHGLAIAILLPHGIRFNLDTVPHRYAELARVMNVVSNGVGDEEAAHALADAVQGLLRDFCLPKTLGEAGAVRETIPRLATNAMLDHCHRTNPRPCTLQDMQKLFEQAF